MKVKNFLYRISFILLILTLNLIVILNSLSASGAVFQDRSFRHKAYAQTICNTAPIANPETKECEAPAGVTLCNSGTPRINKIVTGEQIICTCVCETGTPGPTPSPTQPGTPGQPGEPGGPTIPGGEVDESQIHKWASNILYGMIVFGFLYALIMAPYIGFLFAKADPDSIKHAKDLLMSLIYGLLLLALSTSIVGIVGTDILQV